jgi:hypothetical protein
MLLFTGVLEVVPAELVTLNSLFFWKVEEYLSESHQWAAGFSRGSRHHARRNEADLVVH